MPAARSELSLSDELAPPSVRVMRPPSRSVKDDSKHDFSKAKEFPQSGTRERERCSRTFCLTRSFRIRRARSLARGNHTRRGAFAPRRADGDPGTSATRMISDRGMTSRSLARSRASSASILFRARENEQDISRATNSEITIPPKFFKTINEDGKKGGE
jgi:hypothetical protein